MKKYTQIQIPAKINISYVGFLDSSLEVLRLGVLMIMGSTKILGMFKKNPTEQCITILFISATRTNVHYLFFGGFFFGFSLHRSQMQRFLDPHWAPQKGDFRLASHSHGEFHRIFPWEKKPNMGGISMAEGTTTQ